MTVCLASVGTPPAAEYFYQDEIVNLHPTMRLRFGYPNYQGGASPRTAIGFPACTAILALPEKIKFRSTSSWQKYSPGVGGWQTHGVWAVRHITGLTP